MRPRSEQPVVRLILRELELGPATAYDLAEVLGLHVRNVRPYLHLLRDKGLVRARHREIRQHTPGPNPPVWEILE